MSHTYTNDLIHESSPYLLQHAHNPVNWVPWSVNALEQAKKENKLVLVSVGYSSCHWCHVMEKESFEDEEIANYMNTHFICIKVDREERPDVDQVYMNAVQLMTQRGGWPLNCFALADGRPIYGGTYFPPDQWMNVLKSLVFTQKNDPDKIEEYANSLKEGIAQSELIDTKVSGVSFEEERLHEMVTRWIHQFDLENGGPNRAPKFPLPNNYQFLLRYALKYNDERVKKHVFQTLDKMAQGGIYDQVGGGFARYAVDMIWKVPHFEKMLYDNAQLLSLYADAYKITRNEDYLFVINQTVAWLKREMRDESGAFYTAIDADSEGIEGKYYVWTSAELKAILGTDYNWFAELYEIDQDALWEEDLNILLRQQSYTEYARKHSLEFNELNTRLNNVFEKILAERLNRIPPSTDDKSLTSWNALLIVGLIDAYQATSIEEYLNLALECANWIKSTQLNENLELWHTYKNGKSTINGFLEDYACVISAWVALYCVTFNENWIMDAQQLMHITISKFEDDQSGMFYFTEKNSELIVRKMEINDNVIPSTNSIMANNLFQLGKYFATDNWIQKAQQMLANVYNGIEAYGSGYSNWAWLLMNITSPFYETIIGGKNWKKSLIEWNSHYIPESIIAGGEAHSKLEITQGKLNNTENLWYVCENKTCKAPVNSFEIAYRLIKSAQ